MTKQIIFLLLFSGILFSCMRELTLEIPPNDNLVVLNGVLVADSTPIEITLNYSKALTDSMEYIPINDAVLNLFADQQLLGKLVSEGGGKYSIDETPLSGVTYRIEAKVNEKEVWAETTIPSPIPVSSFVMDSFQQFMYKPKFITTLNDDATQENYYWFWFYNKQSCSSEYEFDNGWIYSGSPYFDDFRATDHPSSGLPYKISYGFMARMPDDGFNGENYTFDILDGSTGVFKFHLNSFDEHYDKYMKSYLTYQNFYRFNDDQRIYYQPSFVYSNINGGGVGIFGSMSTKIEHRTFHCYVPRDPSEY